MTDLPIGHYLGIFPAPDARWCHEVRLGPDIARLTEAEAAAWTAPAEPAHPAAVLAGLRERGLLARPDSPGFARAYRLLPLLSGLGADPDDPDRWHLGAFGRTIVTVDRAGYDLWAEAAGHPSLWSACLAAEPDGPHAALAALLDRLGPLLTGGAACLDLAVPC